MKYFIFNLDLDHDPDQWDQNIYLEVDNVTISCDFSNILIDCAALYYVPQYDLFFPITLAETAT